MSDAMYASESPYERFRRGFTEHPERDGPSLRLLDDLSPNDRIRAEQLLLTRVDQSPAAMAGLAHLRSQSAVEPLRTVIRRRSGSIAVRAAIAMWQIAEDEEAFQLLCRAVEHKPLLGHRPGRADAAAMLARITRPAALSALIRAVDDRDVAVRAHAIRAVAERLRLNAEADALRSGIMAPADFQAAARTALAKGEPS